MLEQAVALLILVGNPDPGPPAVFGPAAGWARTGQQPDVKRARPLGRWPDDRDLARLQSAEGKPRWLVLLVLGHPSAVHRKPGGGEAWDYPWLAACRVWFKNGVCV